MNVEYIRNLCNNYFSPEMFTQIERKNKFANKNKSIHILCSESKEKNNRKPGVHWLYFNKYKDLSGKIFFISIINDELTILINQNIKKDLDNHNCIYDVDKKNERQVLCIYVTPDRNILVCERPPSSPPNLPPKIAVAQLCGNFYKDTNMYVIDIAKYFDKTLYINNKIDIEINKLKTSHDNITTDTNRSSQNENVKSKLQQSSNYYGTQISSDELEKNEQKRREIGKLGENLIDEYFNERMKLGEIKRYTWMRDIQRARSSFDFEIIENNDTTSLIEVKSSSQNFSTDILISLAEIKCMADQENYYLYRVYELSETGGKLRIAQGMHNFAQSILDSLDELPPGVHVDSFSVKPKQIESYFGEPILLSFSNSDTKSI